MVFGIADSNVGAFVPRRRDADIPMDDPVAEFIEGNPEVFYGHNRQGALIIACPFGDEHSTGEPDDGSTVYFRAGTGGYARGHFKCMHAHCEGRPDAQFLAALNYEDHSAEEDFGPFQVIDLASPQEPGSSLASLELPVASSKGSAGKGTATLTSVSSVLRSPAICRVRIGFDAFLADLMIAQAGDAHPQWRPVTDVDYVRLREDIARRLGMKPISRDLMRDSIMLIADENRFDSAQTWLGALVWDGVPRVEKFLSIYFGAEDTAYADAVSRYIWTALAGRIIEPGLKADMVPVAVGAQGSRKSSAIAAMAPDPSFFGEIDLNERDSDTSRRMRGKLILELAELKGIRARDAESIKAFLSFPADEWVPKYMERPVRNPRRFLVSFRIEQQR